MDFTTKNLLPALYFLIPVISACSGLKKSGTIENKNGVYHYSIIKGTGSNSPIVCGTVADFYKKQPLTAGIRNQHHLLTQANTKGVFFLNITPGKYRFEARAIPFAIGKTKSVKLFRGDTLKIDFLLKDYRGSFKD